MDIFLQLSSLGKLRENVPLAPYTTFQIGGPARYFLEIETAENLLKASQLARQKDIPLALIAGGSNVLVADQGFFGLVIKLKSQNHYIFQKEILKAEAQTNLGELVNAAQKQGLSGLEWATGIPGSLGGAIVGNAGAYGREMSNLVQKVIAFDQEKQEKITFSLPEINFSYRQSLFKEKKKYLLLTAELKLKKGDKEKIKERMEEIREQRRKKIENKPSAGCIFKNPPCPSEKLAKEFFLDKGVKLTGGKIPAGYLIEKIGLKGKKIGQAAVSCQNANFIVNLGSAQAQDVLKLISLIKEKVRRHFCLQLQEEIEFIGF